MVQLSFRSKLMIGYTLIVAIPLAVVGIVAFVTVSRELNSNLDSSLLQVVYNLEMIIKQKQRETQQPLKPFDSQENAKRVKAQKADYFAFLREQSRRKFIGPVLPPKDTSATNENADAVWSAVYERILLNPKNYLIQVADTSGIIVWRSENLQRLALPLASAILLPSDPRPFHYTAQRYEHRTGNNQQVLRLIVHYSGTVQISVGYPVDEIDSILGEFFFTLLIATPLVLLAAVIGGWLLARYFVQPVEIITRTAKEITAHNLSQRLPVRPVNDEITRLTETLNEMISRLEHSFRQVKQFTGDASHELRTPLAILMGELEIALYGDKSKDEYQEIIASALEEVNRLSQVVQNLLELAHADSGHVQIVHQPVNMSDMVEDIVEDAQILAEEKEIQVVYHCMSLDTEPIILSGDKVRLHEAILNIIDNAIKYTPQGGNISITLEREDQHYSGEAEKPIILLSVSDTGIGIPADDIPHIFDRFYRVDKARAASSRGHGLGLSLVQWIVEAHQGTIHVQSHLGRGTTFILRLPLGNIENNAEPNNEQKSVTLPTT